MDVQKNNNANVAKSLLEGDRDHLLTQTRSELMKQERKVESLNNCMSELQQQTVLSDWDWRTHITDTLNLDENSSTTRRISHERASSSRNSDWKYS